MHGILDRIFDEEGRLGPRTIVAAGLAAWALLLLEPLAGGVWAVLLLILMILALSMASYAALRELLAVMDPRDAEADRFVVWGSALLILLIGFHAFGIWFLPALILAALLIRLRVPELYEVFPWFEKPGDTGLRQ